MKATAPLTIDISPTRDGAYCVTAHLESGDAHDFFATQEQALAFAQSFYGGKVVKVTPAQPVAELVPYIAECFEFTRSGKSFVSGCKAGFYGGAELGSFKTRYAAESALRNAQKVGA